MAEQQKPGDTPPNDPPADPPPSTVSQADYDKLLAMHTETKTQLKDLGTKYGASEDAKLQANKEFETLAEKYKGERDAAVEKGDKLTNAFQRTTKITKIQEELTKAGVRPEAMMDIDLLEFTGVEIEMSDKGNMKVNGAESFVERLKASRPHWFSDKVPPNFNGGDPKVLTTGGGEVTLTDLRLLEKEADKPGGDKAKYRAAFSTYQQQRAAKRAAG